MTTQMLTENRYTATIVVLIARVTIYQVHSAGDWLATDDPAHRPFQLDAQQL